MKRDEKYIPFGERTPEELCRDISLKAEKLFLKNDKFGLLFYAVLFLVFLALHLCCSTDVNLWIWVLVVVAFLAVSIVFFGVTPNMYDKKYILILAAAALVCTLLQWNEKMYMDWLLGAIVVGGILMVYFVSFLINKKLINDMSLAAPPKQYLLIAKRLKTCVLFRNYLAITLVTCFPFLICHDFWRCVIFSLFLVVCIIVKPSWIDNDFDDDLEELELSLEE